MRVYTKSAICSVSRCVQGMLPQDWLISSVLLVSKCPDSWGLSIWKTTDNCIFIYINPQHFINDLLKGCFGNERGCDLVLEIEETHRTVVMEIFCASCKCQLYENKKQDEKVKNYFPHHPIISKGYMDIPCELTDKKSKPGIANC